MSNADLIREARRWSKAVDDWVGGEVAVESMEEIGQKLDDLADALERAEAERDRLANRLRDSSFGGDGSHWEGCWRSHIDCARSRIEIARRRKLLGKGA